MGMKIDWKEKCEYGVPRELAAQHAKCATCKCYELSNTFPNACHYESWKGN